MQAQLRPFKMRRNHHSGYTLSEVIVTLSILSLLTVGTVGMGMGVWKHLTNQQFEAECEQLLKEILVTKEMGMMSGDGKGATVTLYTNKVYLGTYENGVLKQRSMVFKHLTIKVADAVKIAFSPDGTNSTSNSYWLKGRGGQSRYLVVQPGGGRVYLSDEKPR